MWNLPNILTLSRIPMTFVVVALMYAQWRGAPTLTFVLFVGSAVTDWLDGYIARRRGMTSNFGKFMDALSDKVLVLGLMIAFVEQDGRFLPFVLLTVTREFIVSGVRMVAAAKGVIVPADRGGKSKTLMQLIALGCLLAAPMVGQDVTVWLGVTDIVPWTRGADWLYKAGFVGFVLGTALALWSGWRYLRNGWHLLQD
jgi:CDP-diacylglycerol---glycerol-3-phosphate 3-phosphatidyltransferase